MAQNKPTVTTSPAAPAAPVSMPSLGAKGVVVAPSGADQVLPGSDIAAVAGKPDSKAKQQAQSNLKKKVPGHPNDAAHAETIESQELAEKSGGFSPDSAQIWSSATSEATSSVVDTMGAGAIQLAQLELPVNPSSAAAGGSVNVGSAGSFGGWAGIFGGAAAVGLAAGGQGGRSSAGTVAPILVASPNSAPPSPTAAASDVISLFSDKYTNAPVENWSPNWGQASSLSDAKPIQGDNIKRILNLDFQGVQIAKMSSTGDQALSGVLDVSGKTSLHMDYWLATSGNFTLKLASKDGTASSKEAGVVLNGQAGWNSVDIGLDNFTGIDTSKVIQLIFVGGSAKELHFDNVYFSNSADNYSAGIGGRLVNGYISNAIVFQDNNGNGSLDNDRDGVDEAGEEPFTLTGSDGKFNLLGASATGGSLVTLSTSNTIDESTGVRVTNVFKAPANASVISPLSTVLEAGIKSGLTEAQLKTALNLDANTDLLDFDPVAKALSGNSADAGIALKFKAASVMISNLMDVGSGLIQGAKGDASTDFSASVVSSLVSSIKSNPSGLDLSDAAKVGAVLTQAMSSSSVVTSTDMTALVTQAAGKLKDSNDLLIAQSNSSDPIAALENIAKIEKVVQSTVSDSVKSAAQDPSKPNGLDTLSVATESNNASVPKVLKFQTMGFDEAQTVKADAFEGGRAEPLTQSDGNTVLGFVKPAGSGSTNAGVTLSTGKSGTLGTVVPFDFSDTTSLGMWVHSAQAGTKVRLEIGDSQSGGYPNDNNWVAVESLTTKAGWDYLTFDFANPSTRWITNGTKGGYEGKVLLKDGVTYDTLSVFFDLGSTKLADQTYYIDDLGYAKTNPSAAPLSIAYETTPAIPAGYTLKFSDEFGGDISSTTSDGKTQPDAAKWALEIGKGPNGDGWGNGEAQTYTDSLNNAYVQGGGLHIVADKTGDAITSARLKSAVDLEPYGYMEVRAKLPASKGAWPAIWMLGEGNWPDTGEIDVMEWTQQYFSANQVQSALHFKGTNNPADNKAAWTYGDTQIKKSTTLSSPITEFHTYQVWWTQDYIRFGVDGNNDSAYYEYKKPSGATSANWPFDNPMDIILNMAIGGTYGGALPTGNFIYEMTVDYVRLYQNDTPSNVGLTNLDFEDSSALTLTGFEGAGSADGWGSSVIAADPLDSTNDVVKVAKAADAQPWAGTTVNPDAPIVFDASHKVLSLRVYSEEANIPVVLKLEGANVQVITQKTSAGWQDLNFDFSEFIAKDQVSLGTAYDAVSVFVNFNTAEGAPAQGRGKTYYFDDLTLGLAYNPPVALTNLDFEDSSALTLTGFEGAGSADGWGSSVIAADPLDSTNDVVKVAKAADAQPWAGTTVNPDAPIVFDASHKVLSLRVYSEEANIPVVLKLEGANVQVITQKTSAGWQDLNFDFSEFIAKDQVSLGTAYDAVSVFVNFNTAEGAPAQGRGKTYYFDDLTLGLAYNPPVALTNLDFEDSSALTLTGFEGAGSADGWGSSVIAADPLDSTNDVVKVAKAADAQPWAGTTVNPDAPIVFDASHKVLSLRVYSEEANIPVVLKLEGANVQVITQKTSAGWQDLNFDFSEFIAKDQVSLGTAYDAVSVFVNFNTAEGAPAQGRGKTYYFDDLTLGQVPLAPIAAAPAPSAAAADVVSLYSDAYTNSAVDTWSPSWDQADLKDVTFSNNSVKEYSNLGYAVIDFSSQTIDASSLSHLHLDIWKKDPDSVFKIKLVDFGANGVWEASNSDNVEAELSFNTAGKPSILGNQWVGLDIPLSDFTGLSSRENLAQLIVSGAGSGDTVWLDNVYFHNNVI